MAYGELFVDELASRIKALQQRIVELEKSTHRQPHSVHLLAVSKGQLAPAILTAFEAGVVDFGENYVQEAREKQTILSEYPLTWHFIGSIQGNKIPYIAQHFSWVHGVSSIKVAEKLNQSRTINLPPLNVCIQVNLENEATKAGVDPEDVAQLAAHILTLPHLKLRGLMLLPTQQSDEALQYLIFLKMNALFNQLNHEMHAKMDTLSLGMSDDFPAAIRAGSTLIRVGRGIFGDRI